MKEDFLTISVICPECRSKNLDNLTGTQQTLSYRDNAAIHIKGCKNCNCIIVYTWINNSAYPKLKITTEKNRRLEYIKELERIDKEIESQ